MKLYWLSNKWELLSTAVRDDGGAVNRGLEASPGKQLHQ